MGILSSVIKWPGADGGRPGGFEVRLGIDGVLVAGAFDAAAQRVLGMEAAPEKGSLLLDCFDRRFAYVFAGAVYECVLKKRSLAVHLPRFVGDGQQWLLVALIPDEGTVSGGTERRIKGTVLDVTNLVGSELVQHFTEYVDRHLMFAIERLPDPVLLCALREDELPITYVNSAFTRIFGFLPQEARGRDALQLVFARSYDALREVIQAPHSQRLENRWHVFECRGVERPDFYCHVKMDYHGEPEFPELVRFTLLVERSSAAGWQGALTMAERQRIEIDTLLNASASLINDFTNLLSVVLGDKSLGVGHGPGFAEEIRASHARAHDAADILRSVLARTLTGRALVPERGVPAARDDAVEMRRVLESAPRMHVLVVDEEPSLREAFAGAIRAVGHDATAVALGQEAVDIMRAGARGPLSLRPHLLIVDYHLDDIPGLNVVEMVRGCGLRTPVLLVSGHFPDNVKQRAASLEPLVLLEKPFKVSELLYALTELARAAGLLDGADHAVRGSEAYDAGL